MSPLGTAAWGRGIGRARARAKARARALLPWGSLMLEFGSGFRIGVTAGVGSNRLRRIRCVGGRGRDGVVLQIVFGSRATSSSTEQSSVESRVRVRSDLVQH